MLALLERSQIGRVTFSEARRHAAKILPRKRPRMSIRWDEAVIEEHDKLRGTRMKIDEPDTPYEHYTMADDAEGESLARPRVCPGAR